MLHVQSIESLGLGIMKKFVPALLAVGCFPFVCCGAHAAEQWLPTRKAWDGCHWSTFADAKAGIKLLYQDCKDPSAHYVFSMKGNVVEKHRPADDVTFNGPTAVEIYEKPVESSMPQAIKTQFIDTLSSTERANCYVVKEEPLPDHPGIERYRIVPKASYEKKITDAFMKENPEGGIPYDTICGDHGQWAAGVAYFEYHPAESKTKFIYVIVGQDEPLFDENSIVLMDSAH